MTNQIQYFTNQKGQKTSVIVPYKKWEELQMNLEALQNKLNVFLSIQEGIEEVKQAKKSGVKLQKLADFLNESRG